MQTYMIEYIDMLSACFRQVVFVLSELNIYCYTQTI